MSWMGGCVLKFPFGGAQADLHLLTQGFAILPYDGLAIGLALHERGILPQRVPGQDSLQDQLCLKLLGGAKTGQQLDSDSHIIAPPFLAGYAEGGGCKQT